MVQGHRVDDPTCAAVQAARVPNTSANVAKWFDRQAGAAASIAWPSPPTAFGETPTIRCRTRLPAKVLLPFDFLEPFDFLLYVIGPVSNVGNGFPQHLLRAMELAAPIANLVPIIDVDPICIVWSLLGLVIGHRACSSWASDLTTS